MSHNKRKYKKKQFRAWRKLKTRRNPYFLLETQQYGKKLSAKEIEIISLLGNENRWMKLEEIPACPSTLFRLVDKGILWEKLRPTTEFTLARYGVLIFLANYSKSRFHLNPGLYRVMPSTDWRSWADHRFIIYKRFPKDASLDHGTPPPDEKPQLL